MRASLADIAAKLHTINPDTGLSTDFLNQYNELSMMLDLAADDPDMLEGIRDWAPRSYREHFAASGFKDWALVVEAYDLCPPAIRTEFDAAISVLNSVATSGIDALLGDDVVDTAAVHALAAKIQAAIIHTGGLINGSNTLGSQAQVDTLFARAQAERAETTGQSGPAFGAAQHNPTTGAGLAPAKPGTAAPASVAADDELLDQDAIDALFD